MVWNFDISALHGFLTSYADDLRVVMLKPHNELSLVNGSWNFGGKHTLAQRLLKKAANCVLKKTIARGVKQPANDDSKYPRNVIGILRKMIEITDTQLNSVQNSAINYLRIIVDYGWFAYPLTIHTDQDTDDARQEMIHAKIIKPLLLCLKAPSVDDQTLCDVFIKIARDSECFNTTHCVTCS